MECLDVVVTSDGDGLWEFSPLVADVRKIVVRAFEPA